MTTVHYSSDHLTRDALFTRDALDVHVLPTEPGRSRLMAYQLKDRPEYVWAFPVSYAYMMGTRSSQRLVLSYQRYYEKYNVWTDAALNVQCPTQYSLDERHVAVMTANGCRIVPESVFCERVIDGCVVR